MELAFALVVLMASISPSNAPTVADQIVSTTWDIIFWFSSLLRMPATSSPLLTSGHKAACQMAHFFGDSALGIHLEGGTLGLPSGVSRWLICLVGDAEFPLRMYLMRPNPGKI